MERKIYNSNIHIQFLSVYLKVGCSQNAGLTWQSFCKVLVLLLVNLSQTTPSEAEDEEGVGIGGLYGDTLIRSFQGSNSNHQPHIKLSSPPIASKALHLYFIFPLEEVGASLSPVRGPSLMDILDLHQKSIDCECTAFTDLSPPTCFAPQ